MLHARLRAAAGRDRIPTDGLIAHYTMDNVAGSTLVDEMGNYGGTISGSPAFNAGILGNAIDFSGNSGYIGSFGMTGVLLDGLSFWLYTPSSITSASPLEVHGTISTLDGFIGTGAVTTEFSGETLTVEVFSGSLSNFRAYYIKDTIPAGWNHIVMHWTGAGYEFSLNGSAVTTFIFNKGAGGPTGRLDLQHFQLGKRFNYSQFSTKKVDQVRVYSNAGAGLSVDEITALYNEGA